MKHFSFGALESSDDCVYKNLSRVGGEREMKMRVSTENLDQTANTITTPHSHKPNRFDDLKRIKLMTKNARAINFLVNQKDGKNV